MKALLLTAATALAMTLTACGAPQEAAAPPSAPAETAAPAENAAISMRNMAPLTIGPYDVQPMFEEELEDGHYNFDVTGGEVAAVRVWIGDEGATDAMVVKTEIEKGYYHGHLDVPSPIPADAMLWVEIEAPDGALVKGSTPLAMVE